MSHKLNIGHCCPHMNRYIDSTEEDLIEYEPSSREYTFILHKDGERTGVRQKLWYCPWCGTELPKDLTNEWEQILEEEYGITEKDWWDESKIPPEFKTDEWWKKRGL